MILLFYTALILGYKIDGEHVTTRFWMQSYEQCLDAMDHIESLYDYIADNISDTDIYLWCEKSEVVSNFNTSIRPVPRPEQN
tara:strand:- start:1790 stop:2035 length:246 start_codon:yes stop_codon:yes gene_type:complete